MCPVHGVWQTHVQEGVSGKIYNSDYYEIHKGAKKSESGKQVNQGADRV